MSARAVALTLAAALCPAAGHAQRADDALLDRRARLDVAQVGLDAALYRLQRTSGVPLAFSPDLARQAGRVSCACHDVTLRVALERLLHGTALEFVEQGRRIIVQPVAPTVPAPPASDAVVLVGVVRALPDSAPLAGARVRVSGRAGELRTDDAGRFRLRLAAAERIDLHVAALGYAPRRLIAARGGAGDVMVLLEPRALELREMIVTPGTHHLTSRDAPSTYPVSMEDVDALPQLGEDLFRALSHLPGIASEDASARLHVRGGESDQLQVLLDGVELYEPFHLPDLEGTFTTIDLHAVGDLSLNTGGFTAEYGTRGVGVLEMTPRPAARAPRFAATAGFLGFSALASGRFAGGRGEWLGSARRGFLDVALSIIGTDVDLSPRFFDAYARVRYHVAGGHTVSVNGLLAGDDTSFFDPDDGVRVASDWTSGYGWANWDAAWSSSVSARTTLAVGDFSRRRVGGEHENGVDVSAVDDRRDFTSVSLKQAWSLYVSDRLLIRAGGEVRREAGTYDYVAVVRRNTMARDPSQPITTRLDTMALSADPSAHRWSAFLTGRVALLGPLIAEVGARYDRYAAIGRGYLGPRANLALAIGSRTTLRAAWGYAYQAQAAHELDVPDGDATFYPAERSEHRVVSLEHQVSPGLGVRVEAYRRTLTDPRPRYVNLARDFGVLPEVEPDRLRWTPSRGTARGLETLVQGDVGGRLDWNASYVVSWAEDVVDGTLVPRLRDQRHALNLGLTYRPSPAWSLSAAWIYHSGWPITLPRFEVLTDENGDVVTVQRDYTDVRTARVEAYHRMDVRVERHVSIGRADLGFFLDVFNVYNHENLRAYDFRLNVFRPAPTAEWEVEVVQHRSEAAVLPMMPTIGVRVAF